jgi:hypothetical protein
MTNYTYERNLVSVLLDSKGLGARASENWRLAPAYPYSPAFTPSPNFFNKKDPRVVLGFRKLSFLSAYRATLEP